MWCDRCNVHHDTESLHILIIKDLVTGGEQMHLVETQEALEHLQEEVNTEDTEFVLVEGRSLL